ncbi:MAG: heavy-metal-associated domain-containing protein [Peptostreptococcaceae bacterium]|nr:heavy-metal-associated domain-containing protein [Peptostreptococcaceae bacterium]
MKQLVEIKGMSCAHCVAHVKEALKKLNNVEEVTVNLELNNAVIKVAKEVDAGKIISAINEIGYEVTNVKSI